MKLTNHGYTFGGVPVTELSKNFGTPLYVYNGVQTSFEKIIIL